MQLPSVASADCAPTANTGAESALAGQARALAYAARQVAPAAAKAAARSCDGPTALRACTATDSSVRADVSAYRESEGEVRVAIEREPSHDADKRTSSSIDGCVGATGGIRPVDWISPRELVAITIFTVFPELIRKPRDGGSRQATDSPSVSALDKGSRRLFAIVKPSQEIRCGAFNKLEANIHGNPIIARSVSGPLCQLSCRRIDAADFQEVLYFCAAYTHLNHPVLSAVEIRA